MSFRQQIQEQPGFACFHLALDDMLASLEVHVHVFSQILPVHVGASGAVVKSRRLEDGRSVSLNDLMIHSDLLLVIRTVERLDGGPPKMTSWRP